MNEHGVRPDELCALISRARHHLSFACEADMQQALTELFTAEQVDARPQVRLGPAERPDFITGGGVAVEIKTGGTAAHLARQITRYAAHDEVTAIVVITSRARHRTVPREINGKPVLVLWLSGLTG